MILEAKDVTKKFGGLVAVGEVSLAVGEGEILGIIGPNGAGKTTFLNVIAGVYKSDAGSVHFRGQDITGLSSYQICRKGIARTFQVSRPFPQMTALENVAVAAIFGPQVRRRDPWGYSKEMLEFVEFDMPYDTLAENLNTPQLRRMDLARALASEPGLVLLDEVAAGLTPVEYLRVIDLIRKIRERGVAIVIVEHLMQVIMRICDRIAVLSHGIKIAEGTPVEIRKNKEVIDAYLGGEYLL